MTTPQFTPYFEKVQEMNIYAVTVDGKDYRLKEIFDETDRSFVYEVEEAVSEEPVVDDLYEYIMDLFDTWVQTDGRTTQPPKD